eukprot:CAMPEP_0195264894 /NCGR_PEP_ID=MMETSP0706-20130129/11114_1 /TAXON_ID=33640 /ORGANISM="Asterionellopsis glacialis, Strain CCMP134" /LENGTH=95 /DNA_ID=CAMNT_0040319237 /DNA_START=150 /DNA_END=437 /DNA_ORIENTATION=+
MPIQTVAWSHGVLNFARIGGQQTPQVPSSTAVATPSRSSGSVIPVYTHGENSQNDEDGPRSIISNVDTSSFGHDESITSEMVDLVYERVMRRAGL